jgi:hypothetical protein
VRLFTDLSADFDQRQILELTATAGWYRTIAYLIGVARGATRALGGTVSTGRGR